MPRCEYTSIRLEFDSEPEGDFSGDGSGQCWVDAIGKFPVDGIDRHLCALHAPADAPARFVRRPVRGFQAATLTDLFYDWEAENNERRKTGLAPTDFVLPGIACGEFVWRSKAIYGNLILPYSRFRSRFQLLESQYASVDLNGCRFTRHVSLNKVRITGGLQLAKSSLSDSLFMIGSSVGQLDLFSARISGQLFVVGKEYGHIEIENTYLGGRSQILKCSIGEIEYEFHVGQLLSFFDTTFSDQQSSAENSQSACKFVSTDCSLLAFSGCDLRYVDFLGSDIRNTRFDSCQWLTDEKYSRAVAHDSIVAKGEPKALQRLRSHYSQLKKNYEEALDYQQAGDFHYREMQLWQKLLRQTKTKKNRWDRFFLLLYGVVTDFGQGYMKIAKWLVGSLGVAAGLLLIIESTYYGLKTKSTLGFLWLYVKFIGITLAAIIPSAFQRTEHWIKEPLTPASRGIIITETVVVAVLVTLFVMAIRRRFRR